VAWSSDKNCSWVQTSQPAVEHCAGSWLEARVTGVGAMTYGSGSFFNGSVVQVVPSGPVVWSKRHGWQTPSLEMYSTPGLQVGLVQHLLFTQTDW